MPTLNPPASPWLESARQSLDSYRSNADRMLDLAPSWDWLAPDAESLEIVRLIRDSLRARAGVVREWFLSPLWLTGVASPEDLGNEVQAVIEADRLLAEAWLERFSGQARQLVEPGRDVARLGTDPLTRTVESSSRKPEIAPAPAVTAADGAESVTETVADLVGESIERASAAASAATEMAVGAAEEVVATTQSAAKSAVEAMLPVKANTGREGEKIFHVPGQASYAQLQTETLFASQSDAIAAGYRIARSAGGPAIKGNIGRDGTRIYHMPGQVNYDRVEPEALFETEAEAVAEGFRPAQR